MAGRDERRRFWAAIAVGLESEDAALEAGVPPAVGTRWFRKAGGYHPQLDNRPSRSWTGISRSRSGRKSRFFARRATQCGKSLAGWGGQRRRSHGSCGAMPPLEAAVWSIARRQRNGMPSEPLAGQSRGSLRSTWHCEPMWRNDWLASSSLRAGLLCAAQPERPSTWTAEGSAVGERLEPGADRPPAPGRLPGR